MKNKITLGYHMLALLVTFGFSTQVLQAQWNPNTAVNLQIATVPVADMQSASTTDAKTWVAFYHENSGNYDMRAQLLDANGYKLLGPDGILVGNKPSGSSTYVFNVCVDASNNLIIGYQDFRSGSSPSAVVYKISETGTQLWGADGIVLGTGLVPNPAPLSNGDVAVCWEDDANSTLKIQKITAGGTVAWATPVTVMVGTSRTTRGQIVGNLAGKFTMVFQKRGTGPYTTLYARQYTSAGTPVYSSLQICNETTAGYTSYCIAGEADTTYFGYFSSVGFRFNSYLQRINPDGTIPWGMNGSHFNTSTGTNDNYQGPTSIHHTPGSPYMWAVCTFSDPNQTVYGIYVQKFLKTTGDRQLSDAGKVVYPVGGLGSYTQSGSLALVADEPMFMFYDSSDKIYATRLDSDGNFIWPGNRVELSSTTAGGGTPKMRHGFTPDGPNRCASVWTENRGGAGYLGYAQGVSIGGLVALVVTTQGSVPAVITGTGGTLQMVATVYPASANQAVTWSIVPGTGFATISTGGLVTAMANGTVYAKATAVQDTTMSDSLLVTISGQPPVSPIVITLPATNITDTSAALHGTVTANNSTTHVSFEWGPTIAYGNTLVATPATVTGNTATPVTASISGLTLGNTYHFRCKGTNSDGTVYGLDQTFIAGSVGIAEHPSEPFSLYPVPNNGAFTVLLTSPVTDIFVIRICNSLGVTVYESREITVTGSAEQKLDLRQVPAGLYTVVITNRANHKVELKTLIRK